MVRSLSTELGCSDSGRVTEWGDGPDSRDGVETGGVSGKEGFLRMLLGRLASGP